MTMKLPILVYRQWNYLLPCSQMEIIIECGLSYKSVNVRPNPQTQHKPVMGFCRLGFINFFLKDSSLSQNNEIKFSYYDKICFCIWVLSI